MTTPVDVVRWARAQQGTPWRHQGRLPGVALDCAGLVICAARALGLVEADFDINGYSRNPDGTLLAGCDAHMQRIDEPELGAVVIVATQVEPQHVGLLGDYRHGGWSIVHAANAGDKPGVVETRLMFSRTLRLVAYYRLPGLVLPGLEA
jgi:cell wall-associated NlpC family hydrolase